MLKYRSQHFAQAAKKAQTKRSGTGGGRSGFIEGTYHRTKPREAPEWFHLSPHQSYTYETWVADIQQVMEVTTPWWKFEKHFIVNSATKNPNPRSKGRDHVCSRGPRLLLPCWSCAYRDGFYAALREIEAEMTAEKGERVRLKEEPLCSKASNFVMGVTVMDTIFKMMATDAKGNIKKTQAGVPIYNYNPAAFMDDPDSIAESVPSSFGWNAHWSFGTTVLNQLSELDEILRGYCAHCARQMTATHIACLACGDTTQLKKPLTGFEVVARRRKMGKCTVCQSTSTDAPGDNWGAIWDCKCGNPEEGLLLGAFDLLLRSESVTDKQSVLHLMDVRLPLIETPEVEQMILNPLPVDKIFAPTPLADQAKLWNPKHLMGLTPDMGAKTADGGPGDGEGYDEKTKVEY